MNEEDFQDWEEKIEELVKNGKYYSLSEIGDTEAIPFLLKALLPCLSEVKLRAFDAMMEALIEMDIDEDIIDDYVNVLIDCTSHITDSNEHRFYIPGFHVRNIPILAGEIGAPAIYVFELLFDLLL